MVDHETSVNVGNNDSYSVGLRFRSTTKKDQSPSEKWHDPGPPVIDKYPWAIRGPHTTTGAITFNVYNGTQNPGVPSTGSPDCADGLWHSVVGVRDYDLQQLRKYIDGVQSGATVTDTTITLNNGDVSTDRHITIGGRGQGQFFNGDIDEFFLCNRVLTPEEIAEWDSHGTLPASAVIKWFKFNEGEGIVTHNDLLDDKTGTLINGATWVDGEQSLDWNIKPLKYFDGSDWVNVDVYG